MAEQSTSALRDKAASVIGQYLLQGYRMLADHCPECETVLLQKKDGSKLCVLCHEILPQDKGNGDVPNDPTIKVHDNKVQVLLDGNSPDKQLACEITSLPGTPTSKITLEKETNNNFLPLPYYYQTQLSETEQVLLTKLTQTTQELKTSQSLDYNILLCRSITSCAKALKALHQLRKEGEENHV